MKPLKEWNGRMGLGHVLLLGAIMLASVFLWISVIFPYSSTLLEALQKRSPFLHDILRGAVAVSILPGTFGVGFVTLYLFQLRWDKTHSQPTAPPNGGPGTRSGNSGVGGGPPSVS
jgi:hypothetical protein